MANIEYNTFALQYNEYGEPSECVDYVYKTKKFDLKDTQMLIKVLASPINVADLVTIRGTYVSYVFLSYFIFKQHFLQENMR